MVGRASFIFYSTGRRLLALCELWESIPHTRVSTACSPAFIERRERTRQTRLKTLAAGAGPQLPATRTAAEALTHASAATRPVRGGEFSNERLEFLGDRVLGAGDRGDAVRNLRPGDGRGPGPPPRGADPQGSAGRGGRRPRSRPPPAAVPQRSRRRRPQPSGHAGRCLRGGHRRALSRRRADGRARNSSAAAGRR